MIPYSRPKHSDLYTLCQGKLLENHTLHSHTYLYSPHMAVPPPPGMHHVGTFFLCGIMTLLYLWDIHSQSVYLQEKSLLRFLLVIELSSIAAVYQLKIKIIHMIRTNLMHFLDTFSMIKIQWAFLSKINTLTTDSQLCGCRGLLGRVVRKEGKYED